MAGEDFSKRPKYMFHDGEDSELPILKANDDKVIIEMQEYQLEVLEEALEDSFRMRMTQELFMADRIAWEGYIYKKDDPEFDSRIRFRECLENIFKDVETESWMEGKREKSSYTVSAIDIWRVIRHERFLHNGGCENDYSDVRSSKPFRTGDDELPKLVFS